MVAALFVLAFFWRWAFHDLPDLPGSASELWDVRREPAVRVVDTNIRTLTVRGPLYGQVVRLTELPSYVPQAFIAIEDRRFYQHDGLDRRGFLRAMMTNVRAGSVVQGGSTLTMQLIKNLILSPDRTMRRKLQEIRLALKLEQILTKDQILELYINRVYLGEQAYGVEAAAQRYFNKTAAELTLSEAALLAALPKAPSRLAPTVNLEQAQNRAEDVLQAMLRAEFITTLDYLSAVAEPAEPVEGSELVAEPSAFGHAIDAAISEARGILGDGDMPPDLILVTTLDSDLQRVAHAAVMSVLDEQGEDRNVGEAALVALSSDGAVRAMVGGRDYLESQFNRATQARRQPGSAFKPVVFAAALEEGYEPSSTFEDAPVDVEGWAPENFGGNYRGLITIEDALKRSINTIAAQVGLAMGPDVIVDMAIRLGITTPLSGVPSISLGAEEVSLIDLTAVYSVFANDGYRQDPFLIEEIRNSRGDIIYIRPEGEQRAPVITRPDARAMSTMLQAVIRDGTGTRAQLPNRQAAGKTGTSQNSRDAWFVGFTSYFTTGVWVGNDDDTPTSGVTGGQLPADIWQRFMAVAHEGLPTENLAAPPPRRRTEREERLVAFYSSLSASFEEIAEGRPE